MSEQGYKTSEYILTIDIQSRGFVTIKYNSRAESRKQQILEIVSSQFEALGAKSAHIELKEATEGEYSRFYVAGADIIVSL